MPQEPLNFGPYGKEGILAGGDQFSCPICHEEFSASSEKCPTCGYELIHEKEEANEDAN